MKPGKRSGKTRERGRGEGFVAIAQILPGMEELAPIKPLLSKKAKSPPETKALTVQAKYHYTRLKQIDELARIGQGDSQDIGFMARLLTLCSLPRTNPGDRLQYKRQNGPYKLIMLAGGDNKLPWGNIPRLLLAWVCTEAVQTQERKLVLGQSLSAFMEKLGIKSDSGGSRGDRTRLRNQIDRLFNCHIDMIYEGREGKASTGGRFAPKTMLWWDYRQPDQQTLWQSWILLGEELFNEIIRYPVPLNVQILKKLKRSSLGLDLYMWLSYKTFTLYRNRQENLRIAAEGGKPLLKERDRLSWPQLYIQFGADPSLASDNTTVQNFRRDVLREIAKLRIPWPELDVRTTQGCLDIHACMPSIAPKEESSRQLPG